MKKLMMVVSLCIIFNGCATQETRDALNHDKIMLQACQNSGSNDCSTEIGLVNTDEVQAESERREHRLKVAAGLSIVGAGLTAYGNARGQ